MYSLLYTQALPSMVVVQVQGACCDILSHASVKEKRKRKRKRKEKNIKY